MTVTLAFDVYGTLIDTQGIVTELEKMIGDGAAEFSLAWREKQLEYTFRRGLMQHYVPFPVCTRQALDFTCSRRGVALSETERCRLMARYRTLPAFSEVNAALTRLRQRQCRLFAFSNGTAEDVANLLDHAGLLPLFDGIVSVDPLKTFKPNPAVYSYFLREADSQHRQSWLVSGNPFDVIGAMASGLHGVWVRRAASNCFDPWGIDPDAIITDLQALAGVLPFDD